MAGDIRIASEPGRGSTFTAVLRLKSLAVGPARETAKVLPDRHVLLALDRPIERRALRLTLEGANVPVEDGPVAGAGDLINAASDAREPFTSVLVDGGRGTEAAAKVLMHARAGAMGKEVLGVIVLDTASKADYAEFQRAGFDAYLLRPVRPQTLIEGLGAGFADAPPPAPAIAPAPRRAPRGGTPISVLLVEDNDINALLARRLLEKAACEVRTSRNGREAVEAFRRMVAGVEPPVDLVLMDLHMPVLGGLEATRAIRQLLEVSAVKGPPIVAVTANAFEEDRRVCLEAGMDDYLAKPFDRDDLHRLLERWCGGEDRTRAA